MKRQITDSISENATDSDLEGRRVELTESSVEIIKGPGLDTQRSGSVPFFTEKFVKYVLKILSCLK